MKKQYFINPDGFLYRTDSKSKLVELLNGKTWINSLVSYSEIYSRVMSGRMLQLTDVGVKLLFPEEIK